MQFKEIIGQNIVKKQLIQSAKANKVSQAMLFLGAEGSGTLPMALAFAQYLNCETPQENDSCGQCNACMKASKYIHPDVFYTYPTIKARALAQENIAEWRTALLENPYMSGVEWISHLGDANKQGNITANECDQIVKQHSLKHSEGKYKIQIIWLAEFLKKEGNKLLKIIEEPPANTVFLLIAKNIEEILVTILSRTQIVKFNRLSEQTIAEVLSEKWQVPQPKAKKIAQIAEGNWNLAQQLIHENNEHNFEELNQWFNLLLSPNQDIQLMQNLVAWVEQMGNSGRENQKLFCKHCLFFLRECLVFYTGLPSKLTAEEQALAQDVLSKVSFDELSKMVSLINNLYSEIRRNANAKIGLMSASFEINSYFNAQKMNVV